MTRPDTSAEEAVGNYDVGDELLVPLLYGLLRRHVDEVHESYGPRLPRLRSEEFYTAPEHVQVAVLLVLGSAWLFGTPGNVQLKDASRDVRGTEPAFSRGQPSFDELQHRRGLRYDNETRQWVAA
jgi:hypothetical protein